MDPKQPQDDFNFDDFINPADKALLESERVKEGIVPAEKPAETAPAVDKVETVVEDPVPPVAVPKIETPALAEGTDSDSPVRAPNEPDWKYNFRVEIYEGQKALKSASSEDERKELKSEMDGIRKQMAQRSKVDVTIPEELPENYNPEAYKADLDKFNVIAKNSGYVHKSEIADVVRQQQEVAREFETVGKAESDFLSRHPGMKDQTKYDTLIGFVMDNFKLQGKTYNGITTILEMAHDTLYPSEVGNKVVASQELSKKLDAVDFTGSTAAESTDPVKAEQKALVEDIKKSSGNDFGWAFD